IPCPGTGNRKHQVLRNKSVRLCAPQSRADELSVTYGLPAGAGSGPDRAAPGKLGAVEVEYRQSRAFASSARVAPAVPRTEKCKAAFGRNSQDVLPRHPDAPARR